MDALKSSPLRILPGETVGGPSARSAGRWRPASAALVAALSGTAVALPDVVGGWVRRILLAVSGILALAVIVSALGRRGPRLPGQDPRGQLGDEGFLMRASAAPQVAAPGEKRPTAGEERRRR